MAAPQSNHVKYPVNVEAFLREDALSFYLLGVFLTDGNIEKISGNKRGLYRAGISSADEDWLEMIRDTISPNRPIWKRKGQEVRRIEIANQDLAHWLLAWGCHERKSLTVEFPTEVPDKYLADCVRGVFDGDGSLTVTTYRKVKNGRSYQYPKVNAYICSGSRGFISGLKEKLEAIGFCPSMYEARKKEHLIIRRDKSTSFVKAGVTWRLQLADRSALPFLRWMYYPGNPMAMPRKAALASRAMSVFSNKHLSTL